MQLTMELVHVMASCGLLFIWSLTEVLLGEHISLAVECSTEVQRHMPSVVFFAWSMPEATTLQMSGLSCFNLLWQTRFTCHVGSCSQTCPALKNNTCMLHHKVPGRTAIFLWCT
jgi:hypothetical protein